MKQILIFCALFGSLLLSGCASTAGGTYQSEPQKRIAAVSAKYPEQNVNLLYIDAPHGFIATKLAIASLKAGMDSNNVFAIIDALSKRSGDLLAVAGDDEAFTSATLERALLAGGQRLVGSTVVYVGGQENQNALTSAAKKADIKVEFVPYP